MKKFLPVLSSALQGGLRGGLLIFALLATTTLWAYNFQSGDLYYNITSNDETYTVEVTYQEESAYNYIMLASAIIPETVIYNDITYSVTGIGKAAFKDCFSLVVVTLPKSIVSIHEEAFYKCTSLSSITMENGIINIEKSAFRYCKSLTSITIPSSMTKIGREVFRNCSSLKSIIWNAKDYVDAVYASPFSDIASQITSFTFGDNIECIPAFLCDGMQKLTSITIPNTVVTMGDCVFRGCSSLNTVTIGNAVKNIGNRAFYTCKSLTSIVIPNSVITIEDGAFWGCTALSSAVVGNSVERIGEYAFNGCSSLSSIIISNSVKEIGARAFYNCYLLDSICLGNSIETIAVEAFCDCSSLSSIIISNSVKTIGSRAFYNCTSLDSIDIPNSVTAIGGGAFEETGIYKNESNWENDVLYIGDCLIEAKSSISDRYTVKNGTRLIAGGAFNFSDSLSSIIIPNSVTCIGGGAFYNCTSLDSIDIPNSVTRIGGGAFEATGIYKNKSNWEDNVLYISNCLIEANTIKSNTYSIKENTRVIADNAFNINGYITSITIPKSVTHIGYNAFYQCHILDTIYSYATTPPIVDTYLCNTDLYELLSLFVPCSTIANYQADVVWGQVANIYCLDSETTSLEEHFNEEIQNRQKLFRDGQLIILRDGKTYNVMGQEL